MFKYKKTKDAIEWLGNHQGRQPASYDVFKDGVFVGSLSGQGGYNGVSYSFKGAGEEFGHRLLADKLRDAKSLVEAKF